MLIKMKKMKTPTTDNKEYCIVCDEDTTYFKSDHVDERNYYVEGAGQLCEKCYYKIYYKEKYEE